MSLRVVVTSFQQRRKMLRQSLKGTVSIFDRYVRHCEAITVMSFINFHSDVIMLQYLRATPHNVFYFFCIIFYILGQRCCAKKDFRCHATGNNCDLSN